MRERDVLLYIFPLLQLSFFALAFWSPLGQGPVFLFLSGFCLCFSIHISFHELIHRTHQRQADSWTFYFATLIIGLPLDGYRLHHLNHHRFENKLGDYSSTWRMTSQGPSKYAVWFYCLAWPYFIFISRQGMKDSLESGQTVPFHQVRLIRQKIFFFLVLVSFVLFPDFGLKYLAMTYIGWAFTSLQNFGQHWAEEYDSAQTQSCGGRTYNFFLGNNGLHWEHHARPELPWFILKTSPEAPRISCPHLLHPLRTNYESKF